MRFVLELNSERATADDVSVVLATLSARIKNRHWENSTDDVKEKGEFGPVTGDWFLEDADTTRHDAWDIVRKLDRERIVKLLEGGACIQCYDSESMEVLRQALVECVVDGDIEMSDLEE